jgi:hypothetical protein
MSVSSVAPVAAAVAKTLAIGAAGVAITWLINVCAHRALIKKSENTFNHPVNLNKQDWASIPSYTIRFVAISVGVVLCYFLFARTFAVSIQDPGVRGLVLIFIISQINMLWCVKYLKNIDFQQVAISMANRFQIRAA